MDAINMAAYDSDSSVETRPMQKPFYMNRKFIGHRSTFHYISTDTVLTYEPSTEIPGLERNLHQYNLYNDRSEWQPSMGPDADWQGMAYKFERRVPYLARSLSNIEDHLPQFLFRVVHDGSMGSVDKDGFRSQAVISRSPGPTEISLIGEKELRNQIMRHTSNEKKDFVSHWISFKTSFMWVLQRARQAHQMKKTNVRLCIVDTYRLKERAIIFKARDLVKAFGGAATSHLFAGTNKIHLAKLEGEFLAWDDLRVATSVIPLKDLEAVWKDLIPESTHYATVNTFPTTKDRARVRKPYRLRRQLYRDTEVIPWRANEWLGMAPFTFPRAVFAGRTRRGTWCSKFDNVKRTMAISDSVLRTAWAVAERFESPYRLPILVAILSMRQRQYSISDLTYGLAILLKGECHHYHVRCELTSHR